MNIALAQINPLIGDIWGNTEKILEYISKAKEMGADLVIFPELTISGYPPKDLLEKHHFIESNVQALDEIRGKAEIPVVVGFMDKNEEDSGKYLFNACAFIENQKIKSVHRKCLLPNYDVFDESRYFDPDIAVSTFELCGYKFAMTICEDLWNETMPMKRKLYDYNPVDELVKIKPDFVINVAASPYGIKKKKLREDMLTQISKRVKVPLIYVNQVGGQDDLIFDGHSFIADQKGVVTECPGFEEHLKIYDTNAAYKNFIKYNKDEEEILNALTLGLKDYLKKCKFEKVVLGLSGGIDSALTAVIAVNALGKENVKGILMPSEYSTSHSVTDAEDLAKNLGIDYEIVPIKEMYHAYIKQLEPFFKDTEFDVTEENIQARIRGNVIMAFSNKFGYMPIATGNKSELSCGYCTLYGDMSGGLCVIGDVYKTEVYKLCRYINRDGEIIPENTITKPPSAELRPGQKDSDSLPDYDTLDGILKLYIEEWAGVDAIVETGYDEAVVRRILRLVDINEYKRRQAAPVLKISLKAFGTGRRMPIAQGWKEK